MNDDLPAFPDYESAEAWMLAEVDDSCVDNFRFAYEDDAQALAEYEHLKSDGCCGSFDEEIIVAGRAARIGCNYGH